MNETVTDLVQELLDTMNELGVPLGENTQKLALLDAESADKKISDLELEIEKFEWDRENYYVVDKSKFEVIVNKALRFIFV